MKKFLSVFLSLTIFIAVAPKVAAPALTFSEAAEMDLRTPSDFTADELRNGLKKDLVDLAEDFVAAEERYGVNAVFLAALAAFESGWGRHCFRENNIFGWGRKSFETKSECIDFVASKIAQHYLSEDGKYYHGMNLYGVNRSYNGSDVWLENVAAIMSKISEKAAVYAPVPDFAEPEETPVSEEFFGSEEIIETDEFYETDEPAEADELSETDGTEEESRFTGGVIVIGSH